jgi:hypothetical protein
LQKLAKAASIILFVWKTGEWLVMVVLWLSGVRYMMEYLLKTFVVALPA